MFLVMCKSTRVLASPSPSFLHGLGKKANTIIHLQYLKQWEGGVQNSRVCVFARGSGGRRDDSLRMVKVRGRHSAAEMS